MPRSMPHPLPHPLLHPLPHSMLHPIACSMRFIIKGLQSAMLLTALAAPALAQDLPPTAVTIKDQSFSLNLVGRIIQNLPQEVRNRPTEAYYDTVIDDIIDTHLAAAAARADGFADNPALAEIATRAYEQVLAQAWFQQAVDGRMTEAMIQQSYDDFVADSESRTEVRARHILVDTREEAEDVIARLDDGADFAALAEEVSTGPSGPNGGELGYFRRGQMVPAFELEAFVTAKGRYTETPVQTQFGWHVILVEDRRIAPAPPLEEVREQLESTLSIKLLSMIVSELREGVAISRLSFDEARAAQETYQNEAASQ